MIPSRLPKIEQTFTLDALVKQVKLGESCRTIITPTDRLARFLRNYEHEKNNGYTRPGHNILDYKTWIKNLWDEYLQLEDPRMLLSQEQEKALWTSIIQEQEKQGLEIQGKHESLSFINIYDTAKELSKARKLLCQFLCFRNDDPDGLKSDDKRFLNYLRKSGIPTSNKDFYTDLYKDNDFFLLMHYLYRQECKKNKWIDIAELPDIIREAIEAKKLMGITHEVIFAGFSNTEPQTTALVEALKETGFNAYFAEIASEDKVGDFKLIIAAPSEKDAKKLASKRYISPYLSPEEEYTACAEWAREKLKDDDGKTYAILAPNLEEISDDLQAVLDKYLCPERIIPENRLKERPYNISYAKPLTSYYAISQALLGLELIFEGLPMQDMGHFLLSPCFVPQPDANCADNAGNSSDGGEQTQCLASEETHKCLEKRAVLYAKMRSERMPHVTLQYIRKKAEEGSAKKNSPFRELAQLLVEPINDALKKTDEALDTDTIRNAKLSLSQWPDVFFAILDKLHFMEGLQLHGTRQLIEKLMKAVNSLKSLEAIFPDPCPGTTALSFLKATLSQKLFQPRTAKAKRLQVMGFMEAQGQTFEEVRIINFQDRVWPISSAPLSYLPYNLQKCYDMPNSSPESNQEFSEHITESIKMVAPIGSVSWARANGSSDKLEEYRLSPLYGALCGDKTETITAFHTLHAWPEIILEQKPAINSKRDEQKMPLLPDSNGNYEQKGGTQVIETWSKCPFRAFAELRLGAKSLDDIEQYPGALDKGNLIHNIMQFFWTGTFDKKHSPELEGIIDEAMASNKGLMADWKDPGNKTGGCRTQAKLKELRGNGDLEDSQLAAIVDICADIFLKALSAKHPHISKTFLELEKKQIQEIVLAFLELETKRLPFKVIDAEKNVKVNISLPNGDDASGETRSLTISAKIDRIDEYTEGDNKGKKCVIDYKSSKNYEPKQWADVRKDKPLGEPDRSNSPQVPIYASFSEYFSDPVSHDNDPVKDVSAAAFARLAPGLTENEMLKGLGSLNDPDPTNGCKGIQNPEDLDGKSNLKKYSKACEPKEPTKVPEPKKNITPEKLDKYEKYLEKLAKWKNDHKKWEEDKQTRYPDFPAGGSGWESMLYLWKTSISGIACQFCHGEAYVSPLEGTCTYCKLASLCRNLIDKELAEESSGTSSEAG